MEEFKPGDYVEHSELGVGKVSSIDAKGNLRIKFPTAKDYFINLRKASGKIKKYTPFKVGEFIKHSTWGTGKIVDVIENEIVIDFVDKQNHRISLDMAMRALTKINPEGFYATKFLYPDKVKRLLTEDPIAVVKLLFVDYNNQLKREDIQRELLDGLINPKDWNDWWKTASELMKKDTMIDSSIGKKGIYSLREKAVELWEISYQEFTKTEDFNNKLKIIRKLIDENKAEKLPQQLLPVVHYFSSILGEEKVPPASKLQSLMLLEELKSKGLQFDFDFESSYKSIIKEQIYVSDLCYSDYQEKFISLVNQYKPDNWVSIASNALSSSSVKVRNISFNMLKNEQKFSELNNSLNDMITGYEDDPKSFVWIAENVLTGMWTMPELELDVAEIFTNLLNLLESSDKKKAKEAIPSVVKERAYRLLTDTDIMIDLFHKFDDDELIDLLDNFFISDKIKFKDQKKVYDLLKTEDRITVYEHFSEIFQEETQKFGVVRQAKVQHYITEQAYNQLNERYKQLVEVELPAATKEMSRAAEFGDFSENAEYDAAKEKQHLIKVRIHETDVMLRRYRVIDEKDVHTDSVMFGTKVTIKNEDTGEEMTYSILGPVEANMSQSIISYESPLGNALLGHKVGETIEFTAPQGIMKYKILNIEKDERIKKSN